MDNANPANNELKNIKDIGIKFRKIQLKGVEL